VVAGASGNSDRYAHWAELLSFFGLIAHDQTPPPPVTWKQYEDSGG